MAKYPHLSKAPIREAIIDIKVKFPKKVTLRQLEEFGEIISAEYPDRSERRFAAVTFGKKTEVQQDVTGYLFRSKGNQQIVQARFDGFTFSRLRPYETWDKFRDEGSRLWKIFTKHFRPSTTERVATRFINEFSIQAPLNLSDYLTASPVNLKTMPPNFESFFTRIVFPNPDIPSITIITQAINKIKPDGPASILLDIDVFYVKSYSVRSPKPWEFIDKFREQKNSIFFESITQNAVELFS